jgi:3-dehydroquinate dehydratase-2
MRGLFLSFAGGSAQKSGFPRQSRALSIDLGQGDIMPKPIYILNGPNLNLLGLRQPEIYGRQTLDDVAEACAELAEELGLTIRFHQSNHEGALIDWIHQARNEGAGIIINPGAFTHTSVAILDALKIYGGPVIELHISNIHARDPIYHKSLMSPVATAVIAGLGARGYVTALRSMYELLEVGAST